MRNRGYVSKKQTNWLYHPHEYLILYPLSLANTRFYASNIHADASWLATILRHTECIN